jgi:hypothetical protein
MDPVQQAVMDQWVARFQLEQAKAKELMEADPRLPYVSALVMASDLIGADKAWEELSQGMPFNQALWCVGSYGRLGFVLKALDERLASADEVLAIWPALWSGSDPNDTDPRFLQMWLGAYWRHHGMICDGEPLLDQDTINVYRGQDADAPLGIAWTTSKCVAKKFARGAATRQSNRDGVVIHGTVKREDVLAYLTGRNEFEIIVDPARVTVTK